MRENKGGVMDISNVMTVVISIFSSSIFTLIISSTILEPRREKGKYIFDEKKRVDESIIIFAQIVLYPKEAKYSLGVARYNIQELSDDVNIKNALNDLKMAIPKLKLITENPKIVERTKEFIDGKNEDAFNHLVSLLRKDLYK
jgi:hypothetical protein